MLLSFTKTFTTFPSRDNFRTGHLVIIRSSSGSNGGDNIDINESPPVAPPGVVEIRFKRGSRRKRKQEQQLDGFADKTQAKQVRKDWDSMSLAEKAIELYVGEKGMLFWLNKFAYASIFIVIGGWLLFRFVGPVLGLYQLDTPPLAPESLFKEGPP